MVVQFRVFLFLFAVADVTGFSAEIRSKYPLPRTKDQTICYTATTESEEIDVLSRRSLLHKSLLAPVFVTSMAVLTSKGEAAWAESSISGSTAEATITDKVFVTVKGLPGSTEPKLVAIGLFGQDAPNCVGKLKKLLSKEGLSIPCRPRAERALQKEQLEANKVYNSCIEGEGQGVNLQYSSIWRVVKDERIDVGAVSGKFVAREYPDWQDDSNLKHDTPGVVSVRRGSDSGFGFTIYPGNGKNPGYLDEEHIVIGRVIEGLDVVHELNDVPVIASSKINYMSITGGTTTKNAPSRSCRYGGPMYCNENKPLVKLSITETGIAR